MILFNWIAPVGRCLQRAAGLRALLCACALLYVAAAGQGAFAEEPIKLAVYDFELEDFSAAGGVVPPDARDATYLAQATEEAKRLLAQSGRYTIVDTAGAQDEPVKAHTIHSCDKCVGPITKKLGAGQAVVGLITRISRTEYTLLIQTFDAATGEPVSRYFTGLRMGANYSWPRGVTSLMKNRILAKRPRLTRRRRNKRAVVYPFLILKNRIVPASSSVTPLARTRGRSPMMAP